MARGSGFLGEGFWVAGSWDRVEGLVTVQDWYWFEGCYCKT